MEVPIHNDGTTVNARTALGVVLIDPATGHAMTGSGGDPGGGADGGGTTLPPNAAQEKNGNLAAISAALEGTLTVRTESLPRTAALTSSSVAGMVAAGATQASFANAGFTAAVVAGGSLPAGYSVSFDAPKGDTLDAIAFDATGTNLMISTVK